MGAYSVDWPGKPCSHEKSFKLAPIRALFTRKHPLYFPQVAQRYCPAARQLVTLWNHKSERIHGEACLRHALNGRIDADGPNHKIELPIEEGPHCQVEYDLLHQNGRIWCF